MAQGYRPDRVADQIREQVSVLLAREVHDPGIGFLTITRVVVSPDLQLARIYYTTIGSEQQRKDTAKALGRATPFLRRQVGQRLKLRRVPVLEFFFDKSVENQARVEELLHEIHEADAKAEAEVARDESHHEPDRNED